MHHPVRMALYMNHLDPEDQRAVRRWSARLAVGCCASALFLFTVVATRISMPDPHAGAMDRDRTTGIFGVGMSSAIAAEQVDMTECASRDLRIVISIEAHGEAQDVSADKLADAFFTRINARKACAAGRVEAALATYDSIVLASDTPRTGWFTPACAKQDLRAFATIEERGEVVGTPIERLADAGLNYLQARTFCLSGQEDEGIALYQNIIDFEAPVLNARKTIERVMR
jgi:hypothetical protein